MNRQEFIEYVKSLQIGEKVIETGQSCMHGKTGTIYISEKEGPTFGSKCVKWEDGMGTSVTHGTRRIGEK